MRLLIKIPSRSRPERLTRILVECGRLWSGDRNVRILVSADHDDPTMAEYDPPFISGMPIVVKYGDRVSKVEAINRDIDAMPWKWDVVLNLADDMGPVVQDFDRIILQHMATEFPDTNGCLWFSDGRPSGERICEVPVMGRTYWEQHGRVIYRPEYRSYFCDDEWTAVAINEGKLVKVPGPMFRHDHPMYPGAPPYDPLLRHNQAHKQGDRHLFHQRKARGFPA